jgi:glycerophosphoryl diester phosphodiesterase
VNEAERIDRLIGWGVDGLISDHPLRVREAMARRGMALPAPASLPTPAR